MPCLTSPPISRCSLPLLPLLLSFLLLLLLLVADSPCQAKTRRDFDVPAFCREKCPIGMGGNLCQCNGFHFPGKRESPFLKMARHMTHEEAGAARARRDMADLFDVEDKKW